MQPTETMRVLVFVGCEGLPAARSGWAKPDMLGGLHSMAQGMASALNRLGHHVEIAFLSKGNSIQLTPTRGQYGRWDSTTFASLRSVYVLFNTLAWGEPWRRFVKNFDAVVVVAGSPYVAHPLLNQRAPVLVWSAVTVDEDLKGRYEHFGVVKKVAYDLALPFVRYQERWVFERCDHFWALSPPTLDDFRATSNRPTAGTSVLFAPIDIDAFRPPAMPPAAPVVLFTGRYNDGRKSTPRLLRAFRSVVDAFPEARLRLVGDDASPEVLAHIRQLDLAAAVDAMGPVSLEQLIVHYQTAQLFIIPSEQEGLCISGIEAMACGLPVISTRCGGPESYVVHGETGLLADQNEASIAEQILRALRDDGLRRQMGQRARERVVRDFSSQSFDNQIDQVLRQRRGLRQKDRSTAPRSKDAAPSSSARRAPD